MATENNFDAAAYWEDRLAQNWGLNAAGFLGLGDGYNEALYRVKGAVFRRTVKSLGMDLGQARILDIGSGTGFVLQQWQTLGARNIMGSDITAYAVSQLQQRLPAIEVRQLDIGAALPQVLTRETFDCILGAGRFVSHRRRRCLSPSAPQRWSSVEARRLLLARRYLFAWLDPARPAYGQSFPANPRGLVGRRRSRFGALRASVCSHDYSA